MKARQEEYSCNQTLPWKGKGRKIPRASWPASLAKLVSSKFCDAVSKYELESSEDRHTHTHTHSRTHTEGGGQEELGGRAQDFHRVMGTKAFKPESWGCLCVLGLGSMSLRRQWLQETICNLFYSWQSLILRRCIPRLQKMLKISDRTNSCNAYCSWVFTLYIHPYGYIKVIY